MRNSDLASSPCIFLWKSKSQDAVANDRYCERYCNANIALFNNIHHRSKVWSLWKELNTQSSLIRQKKKESLNTGPGCVQYKVASHALSVCRSAALHSGTTLRSCWHVNPLFLAAYLLETLSRNPKRSKDSFERPHFQQINLTTNSRTLLMPLPMSNTQQLAWCSRQHSLLK